MNSQFQSSFIPKKPLVAPSPSSRKTSAINLFLLLGVIVFLGSAVTAGVFYFWDKSLQAQIDTNNEQINKFISNFGTSAEKFISTGKRIELAKQILNNHYAVSNAFTILEDLTAKNVRFNSFTYSLSGADEVSIQLKGEARTRNTVAFQSDLFRGDADNVESLVKSPIFSDVRVDEKTGLVSFSVDAKLDKADLLYRNRFEAK